jgi:hypothetical protein
MTKTLPQIAHEYAEANPNVSIELAFLEGMLYHSKQESEKVEQRKIKFKQDLSLFVSKYGTSMITDFYEYWSEMNQGGTKMRFEKEKTWELSKRLKRWADNNNKYDKNRNNFGKREEKGAVEMLFSAVDNVLQGY